MRLLYRWGSRKVKDTFSLLFLAEGRGLDREVWDSMFTAHMARVPPPPPPSSAWSLHPLGCTMWSTCRGVSESAHHSPHIPRAVRSAVQHQPAHRCFWRAKPTTRQSPSSKGCCSDLKMAQIPRHWPSLSGRVYLSTCLGLWLDLWWFDQLSTIEVTLCQFQTYPLRGLAASLSFFLEGTLLQGNPRSFWKKPNQRKMEVTSWWSQLNNEHQLAKPVSESFLEADIPSPRQAPQEMPVDQRWAICTVSCLNCQIARK